MGGYLRGVDLVATRDRVEVDHMRKTIRAQVTVPDWGPCAAQLALAGSRPLPCVGRARHGGQHADRLGRVWGKPDKAAQRRRRRGRA